MSPSFRNLYGRRLSASKVVTVLLLVSSAHAQATTPAPATPPSPPAVPPAAPAPSPAAPADQGEDATFDAEASPSPAGSTAPTPAPEPPKAAAPAAPPAAFAAPAAPAAAPAPAPAPVSDTSKDAAKEEPKAPLTPDNGWVLSVYFQSQYESHQDSEDQLRQGGALYNQNRFVLRRGRIRVARDWDWASLLVELDGNTVRGPTMRIQKAELSLVYGRSKEKGVPPIAQLTMGQFDLPFGFDLVQSPRTRWFMERSTVSRALWPGEPEERPRSPGSERQQGRHRALRCRRQDFRLVHDLRRRLVQSRKGLSPERGSDEADAVVERQR
jgi:hypothetical protein